MKQWFKEGSRHPWQPSVDSITQFVNIDRFVPPTIDDIPDLGEDDDHRNHGGEVDFSHCRFLGHDETMNYYVNRVGDQGANSLKKWYIPLARREGDRPEIRRVASVRCVKALAKQPRFPTRAIAGQCLIRVCLICIELITYDL
jgi:hypothetical protein